MAVAMGMTWEGVAAEPYATVRRMVNCQGDPAAGGLFHIAAADEHGLQVTDVQESPEAFQTFVNARGGQGWHHQPAERRGAAHSRARYARIQPIAS